MASEELKEHAARTRAGIERSKKTLDYLENVVPRLEGLGMNKYGALWFALYLIDEAPEDPKFDRFMAPEGGDARNNRLRAAS